MKTPTLHFQEGSACPTFPMDPVLPTPYSMAAPSENPDARVFLMEEPGVLIAHAALWWRDTPQHLGQRIGTIGGFTACAGDMAEILLTGALDKLRDAGCRIAVGPMNGNTWRRHRFVTESDGRGAFLLEPRNPPEYPGWWRQAGFEELSHYTSSVIDLDGIPTIASGLRERLRRSGMIIRKLDPACYDEELRKIHAISLRSFSSNFLYTPMEEAAFLDAYRRVRAQVDPDFVRIAEREGVPCGFVFAIRDDEAEARGEVPALIVKSLAVDPTSRCAGLGSLLVDDLEISGFKKGYTEAIHALQYETNTSLKITGRHQGRVFRKYALYSKML